jgi:hypothetical protein
MNKGIYSEEEAKKYVIETIRHGDYKRIKEVTDRFRKVYRNPKPSLLDQSKEVFDITERLE